jgi:Domain of unknown function (DUF1844)
MALMADQKDDEEEKGFVVKDKRFSAKKEPEETPPSKEEKEKQSKVEAPRDEKAEPSGPLPEITFTTLIFSLSTSALIQLGEIQDPMTNQTMKNLPLAKQTIDLVGMLKEKTKGNLTSDEDKFVENVLYDLKMRYVKATG